MTDISNLRTPAWRRIVEELSADAPSATAFLARLCDVLTRVANAKQGAVVIVSHADGGDQADAEPQIAYAITPGTVQGGRASEPKRIDPGQVEHASWIRSAAVESVRSGEARVFALEAQNSPMYGAGGDGGAVISGPVDMPLGGGHKATICLTIEQRSREATQTTMALVEVLCGYAKLHAARQEAKGAWQSSAALDLAGRLIASINESTSFKGASIQLVNDLARAASADRVALGWVKGLGDSGVIRVQSLSDTEHVDRRLHMVRMLQAAMEECFDQTHAVVYPVPQADRPEGDEGEPAVDPTLAAAVTHAHRELASSDARLRVASLPIRSGERVVGVVTIELSEDGMLTPERLELLQATLDLIGPVMELRRSDDRPLPQRAWHSTLKTGTWLVGPKHTAWKVAAFVALAILLTITFVKIPYRIDAQAELMAVSERAVAAPFAGVIATVPEGIRPGVQVTKGQLLLQLDTTELRESRIDARASVSAARREADEARKEQNMTAAEQALGRLEQEMARLRYIDVQIERSTITAPIDGTIVSGDPRRLIGSAIRVGEPMFRIASLNQLEVVARVPDSDIGYVSPESVGGFATRARPGERFQFEANSLVPMGQPDEGANIFELRGTLVETPGWLRPGMEGIAYIDTGDRRIIWILSRRIIDTARLWLWY
ncbi:MAG: efflux RND transporter periplasmic adaptor subunit [Phycisphaerales bacterium]|nr:efflux RND transporter periplasmic adaptor subunit [Phycisphaerales bacterium]